MPVTISVTGMLDLQPRVHLEEVERRRSSSSRNSIVPAFVYSTVRATAAAAAAIFSRSAALTEIDGDSSTTF